MHLTKDLIIAAYQEELAWLSKVDSSWRIIVYSKGPEGKHAKARHLLNIGREAHTYLTHIVENFNDLADINVFCQGWPFDHSPRFLERLADLVSLSGYLPLSDVATIFDSYGLPYLANTTASRHGGYLMQFYEKLFGTPCPVLFYCRMNGVFAVDRDTIQRRGREFYARALELITGGEIVSSADLKEDSYAIEAHYFERIWHRIFDDPQRDGDVSLLDGMPVSEFAVVEPFLKPWAERIQERDFSGGAVILDEANQALEKFRGVPIFSHRSD